MKALITDYQWNDLHIEERLLGQIDCEIVLPKSTEEADLVAAARGCDAIMACWAETTATVIGAAENCKIVSRMGIGLDNIDVDFCTDKGIPVTNVPDYCVIEVAEHVLASIFALARKIAFFHLQANSGVYDLAQAGSFRRIKGQTLGIVGLGNIGSYLAKIAQGVGLNVVAYSRTPKRQQGIRDVSMEELLSTSDFVSLNAPLTDQTRNLIDEVAFRLMKPTAFLINTARGGLVDHEALTKALQEKQIAGAALDVQCPEPPDLSQAPYSDPRVIVTPHAAFVSDESLADLRSKAAQQVVDCLSGNQPKFVVNGVIVS